VSLFLFSCLSSPFHISVTLLASLLGLWCSSWSHGSLARPLLHLFVLSCLTDLLAFLLVLWCLSSSFGATASLVAPALLVSCLYWSSDRLLVLGCLYRPLDCVWGLRVSWCIAQSPRPSVGRIASLLSVWGVCGYSTVSVGPRVSLSIFWSICWVSGVSVGLVASPLGLSYLCSSSSVSCRIFQSRLVLWCRPACRCPVCRLVSPLAFSYLR
jgi:hypothetical protein